MKRQLDIPGNHPGCKHLVQNQEKRYESMIYQKCKDCKQELFVRWERGKVKRAKMTG